MLRLMHKSFGEFMYPLSWLKPTRYTVLLWRLETLAASGLGVGWVATGFEFESGGLGNVCCCDGGSGDKTKDTLAVVGEAGRVWELGPLKK